MQILTEAGVIDSSMPEEVETDRVAANKVVGLR